MWAELISYGFDVCDLTLNSNVLFITDKKHFTESLAMFKCAGKSVLWPLHHPQRSKCTWQQGHVHRRVVHPRCSMYACQNKGKITPLPLACITFTVWEASWHGFHPLCRCRHTRPRSNGVSINWAQTSVSEWTTRALLFRWLTFGSLDAGVLVVTQEEPLSAATLVAAHHVDANLLASTVAFWALVHICQ